MYMILHALKIIWRQLGYQDISTGFLKKQPEIHKINAEKILLENVRIREQ